MSPPSHHLKYLELIGGHGTYAQRRMPERLGAHLRPANTTSAMMIIYKIPLTRPIPGSSG